MADRIEKQVETVRRLLDERLRIRGRDLSHQIRKAGRLLPRPVRNDLTYVAEAKRMLTHPKLRLMVDEAKVEAALDRSVVYLKTVDPSERRKDRLLGMAGVVAFNLIVVAAVLIGVLIWRGYV